MYHIARPAALEQLQDLLTTVETEARRIFSPRAARRVLLAAEEVLTNVMMYAYPQGGGQVRLAIETIPAPPGLRLTIADDGIAFDPLAAPEPDITAPLPDRKVGGLGIFLARRMMDRVAYQRRGGENVLVIEKHRQPDQETTAR